MVSISPIREDSIKHFEVQTKDIDEALKLAVKEYLIYFLAYDEEELESYIILDVKKAAKGDVLYIALEDKSQLKEIYFRKVASENQDLVIRDYIAPQYHARYMAVAATAAEQRALNPNIKTQIRWGDHDLKLFFKNKKTVSEKPEPFKKINVKEFMEGSNLPEFDMSMKWNRKDENRVRKELVFGERRPALPSLRNNLQERSGLTRQLSSASSLDNRKKPRNTTGGGSADTTQSDMEQSTSSRQESSTEL